MDPNNMIRMWKEREVLKNKVISSLVTIITTHGCSWYKKTGGCSMCGYFNMYKDIKITDELIKKEFEQIVRLYHGEALLKIYTSGSFLDDDEINPSIRDFFIKNLYKKAKMLNTFPTLLIESRPEYINSDSIEAIKEYFDLIVAQGLETVDDHIRNISIKKGFNLSDFFISLNILKKQNVQSKVYLLLKPPYLNEREAIIDILISIKKLKRKYIHIISVNPINVQKNTLVERLFIEKKYRPPWLWSLYYSLKKAKEFLPNVRIISNPSGGGRSRGVHNCFKCDKIILKNISLFSNDPENNSNLLHTPNCRCLYKWKIETGFNFI